MKINRLVVYFVLIILLGCHNSAENKSKISIDPTNQSIKFDTTLIQIADYTGDGILDTARLHIIGKSFNSPFSWVCDLWSNGQIIYHQEGSDDSTRDRFYADSNYVGHCTDYANCKKKFFFQELGLLINDSSMYDISIADYMKDKKMDGLTYHYIVDSCGITNKCLAEAIVDSIASVIKYTRPKLVSFEYSPVQSGSLMMFVKRFNRFVPVYHE